MKLVFAVYIRSNRVGFVSSNTYVLLFNKIVDFVEIQKASRRSNFVFNAISPWRDYDENMKGENMKGEGGEKEEWREGGEEKERRDKWEKTNTNGEKNREVEEEVKNYKIVWLVK